ncbi:hypothetical protein [Sphingobacterium paludis]|uniref:Uncharacterized protein n=1 Tax=Sphingobacterium paludis TaxID=1476465 RepID=A0A4R7CV89_9SPHI|nr:hypothetical protein [Sphingobacterium paludis]TDS11742.1 hypothetical protein B0I21_10785 [Sphingobacterium paludis]
MTFTRISITDRLPTADHFRHPLDTVLFYVVNGVKFLFGKSKVLSTSKEEWIDKGFVNWMEETE